MQRCFQVLFPGQDGVGSILDEEGGGESVAPGDGEVEETVAGGVEDVQVTAVTDQGVGDTLVAIEEGQVEGEVPLVITLI